MVWSSEELQISTRAKAGDKEKTKNSVQTLRELTHKDTENRLRDRSGEQHRLSEGNFERKAQEGKATQGALCLDMVTSAHCPVAGGTWSSPFTIQSLLMNRKLF